MGWARGAWALVAVLCVAGPTAQGWAQASAQAGSPLATGQRISLDLKGVDILDVLKLLSQKSGLNFIAGRNVTGRVTIFVNDVDVWDAFELIIGANELAYERQGDIITVMLARDYELLYGERFQARTQTSVESLRYAKVVQVATVLNQIKSSVGRVVADEATNTLILTDVPLRLAEMRGVLGTLDRPTITRVYHLNYAEAEKIREKTQELLSPVGTFTVDARTNTVVLTDLDEVVARADRVIRAFDTPDAQVLIEAKIVKIDLSDQMDLGVDWTTVFSGDLTTRTNFRILSDIVGGTAKGGGLKLFTADNDRIQIIIDALKKITKTDTLSSPRIMVSHNQEAKILVGTKEAIVTVTTTVPSTGSTVSSPEIQYVDVGTKLYVTPNIKHDGHIQLKIRPEVSSSSVVEFEKNRIPIVTSTEAETNVLVRSGTTLIIGGLIETKDDRTDNRLPVLGEVPVMGALFRSSTHTKKKSELVVFLTPQIVLPDGSAYVAPGSDPRERAVAQDDALRQVLPDSFRQRVRQHLQEQLARAFEDAGLPPGSVTVIGTVSREGALVGEPWLSSPQGEPFVGAARHALARAQPFPAFPEQSAASEFRFRLTVEYAP